ncbi:MAG TPA: hypothetical protein VNR11_06000 [Xanthobacteraceae bacterium]|nr:hypothetical protein [Xanthobacteraceae bacterium]
MFIIISILTGAVLGTRYTIISLIPVAICGLAALTVIHVAGGEIASGPTAFLSWIGLQGGYVAGVVARPVILGSFARAPRSRGVASVVDDRARPESFRAG